MNNSLWKLFPQFAEKLAVIEAEDFEPPASAAAVQELAQRLGVALPPSYERFLLCTRGFSAFDGNVQLGLQHPFFHKAMPAGKHQSSARSPSEGMLCFAEFYLEADGDQVLFDVQYPDAHGEYPVYYYAHAQRPPIVRKIADSFEQWLTDFPSYEEFEIDEG